MDEELIKARAKERAERIQKSVPLVQLLQHYGYPVQVDAEREQQFPCDLHGDGCDGKPSARVYPNSTNWYCVGVDEPVLTVYGWMPLRIAQAECSLIDGYREWRKPLAYIPKGKQEVFRVTTSAGYSVLVTAEHEVEVVGKGWVAAKDLLKGDELTILKPKDMGNRQITEMVQERLVSLFAEDGQVVQSPFLQVHLRAAPIVTIPASPQHPDFTLSRSQHLYLIQLMLLHLGVYSQVYKTHLRIATQDIALFRDTIGFTCPEKQALLKSFTSRSKFKACVVSVIASGVQEVADLAMPYARSFSAGGIKVHNCFAESKSRDAICTVQDKEGLSFTEACYKLEEMFGLPHPAQVDSYEPTTSSLPDKVIQVDLSTTFVEDAQQTDRLLMYLTKERVLDQKTCFAFWEAFDQVVWLVHEKSWTGQKGKEALAKVRGRALEVGAKALSSIS